MQEKFNFKDTIVLVSDLNVDVTYQGELNAKVVQKIVRDFSWFAFGAIMVNIRKDGSIYIIDGRHRYEAAKQLSFKEVPAKVAENLTYQEEATLCNYMLANRRTYSIAESMKSALMAGDEKIVAINNILENNGIHFAFKTNRGSNYRKRGKLSCFSALIGIYDSKGHKFFSDVVSALHDLWYSDLYGWQEAALKQLPIKGLAFFMFYGMKSSLYDRDRLIKKCGGIPKAEEYTLVSKQNALYSPGTKEKHFALGMLKDYNNKAKIKLDLSKYS
jgi:hypothetical protein